MVRRQILAATLFVAMASSESLRDRTKVRLSKTILNDESPQISQQEHEFWNSIADNEDDDSEMLGCPWFSKHQKAGQGCSAICQCGSGLSCQPFVQKCYHSPRRLNEPCVAGYPCGPGLSCHPFKQKCYDSPRKFEQPCLAGYPCGEGLSCQPGTQICLHKPRRLNEQCSAGFSCGRTVVESFPLFCSPAFKCTRNSFCSSFGGSDAKYNTERKNLEDKIYALSSTTNATVLAFTKAINAQGGDEQLKGVAITTHVSTLDDVVNQLTEAKTQLIAIRNSADRTICAEVYDYLSKYIDEIGQTLIFIGKLIEKFYCDIVYYGMLAGAKLVDNLLLAEPPEDAVIIAMRANPICTATTMTQKMQLEFVGFFNTVVCGISRHSEGRIKRATSAICNSKPISFDRALLIGKDFFCGKFTQGMTKIFAPLIMLEVPGCKDHKFGWMNGVSQ